MCRAVMLSGCLLAVVASAAAQCLEPLCRGGACPAQGWRSVPAQPAQPVQPPHPAVCRVIVRGAQAANLGSGTLVDRGLVLTCAHLFEGSAAAVEVAFPGGARRSAKLMAIDREEDLALLAVEGLNIWPVAVASLAPTSQADALTAAGYGGDGSYRAVRGALAGAAVPVGAKHPSLRMRCTVRPGDSGGPVFDSRGRLVGVVWGTGGGLTYAAYGRPIHNLLRRVAAPRERSTLPQVSEGGARAADRPSPPGPDALSDVDPRIVSIEGRIAAIERQVAQALAEGRCTCPDFSGFVRREELEQIESGLLSRIEPRLVETSRSSVLAILRDRLPGGTSGAWAPAGWSLSRLALLAAGVGGALGLSLAAGLAFARARSARRRTGRVRSPASTLRGAGRGPIAVDTPPPPQQRLPETHYVPVERDTYARAHQWASEQVARKFPGAVEVLTTLDSLIKQQMNAGP